MKKHETLRLESSLEELAIAYKEDFSPERKKIYLRVLIDLSLDDVLVACSTWLCSDSPFFPKPGQLRTLVLNLPSNPHSTEALKARAEQAWQNLRGTATTDPYHRWALADGVTAQVFQVMGGGFTTAAGFGRWEVKYEEVKHREFLQTYVDLAVHYAELAPLPTLAESRRLGQPSPQDDPVSAEEARTFLAGILDMLEKKLSFPPAQSYRHGVNKDKVGSLDSTPSLSPTELEARKNLLRRQGMLIMAQELASKDHSHALD